MGQIAALAAPLILQNLAYTLLGVADTFFVSRVSTEAVAAVGLASVTFFAVMFLFRSAANSSVVFVGRAHGAKNDPAVGEAVWSVLSMVALLSLLVSLLPLGFTFLFGSIVPADALALQELGTRYLHVRSFEIPLVMLSALVWGFFVGRGDSRTPSLLAWGTVALNILLDWLLVLGNWGLPALGVAGAAYATLLANFVNAAVSALLLWSAPFRKRYDLGRVRFASRPQLASVLRVGLPMGLGDFVNVFSFSLFFAILGRLGTEVLAANQIALQYMSVSFTTGFGVAMAASSLVAQRLGAGRPGEARSVGYGATALAMTLMGLIGLSYLIAPGALMQLFTDEPQVVAAGVTVLRIVALYQLVHAAGIVLGGALNGAGDTRFVLWIRAGTSLAFFLPLAWLLALPLGFGLTGAWTAGLLYLALQALLYIQRFRSDRWQSLTL